MTDSTEKLLREAAQELEIVGSYADEKDISIGLKITARKQRDLAERIRVHLSAHPVTGDGEVARVRRKIVLADRRDQYLDFLRDNDFSSAEYRYVDSWQQVIGLEFSPADVILLGNSEKSKLFLERVRPQIRLPAAPMTAASGMDERE